MIDKQVTGPEQAVSSPSRVPGPGARWLILILGIYGFLALAYSLVIPLGESPDEVDHFLYIQHLVQQASFPVLSPTAEENVTMEANQPPLYYLLAAAATSPITMAESADFPLNRCFSFDVKDLGRQTFYRHSTAEQFPYKGTFLAFHVVRVLSVVMGAGTVLLAYALGRMIVTANRWAGLLSASFLAFNPQFIFITASVNNDVLTALLGAAIVTLSILAVRRQRTWIFASLGLVVGLGLLTKFALIALWPVAVFAGIWPILAPGTGQKVLPIKQKISSQLWNLALIIGLPLLAAGWWYIRTNRLYGDPLAWNVHLAAKGSQVLRTGPFGLVDLGDFARLHFQSYWGLFGWLNIQLPDWVYWGLLLLVLVGVTGLVMLFLRWIGTVIGRNRRPSASGVEEMQPGTATISDETRLNKPALFLAFLAVVAIYVSLFRYIQTINWSGYQGRLAYAVAAPIAALLGTGWYWTWLEIRRQRRMKFVQTPAFLWLLPGMLSLLAAATLVSVLAPAYPRPVIYQPGSDISPLCLRFSDALMLDGYKAPERVLPGETTHMTIYGYGLQDGLESQLLRVQLIGRGGQVVAHSTDEIVWRAGDVISRTLALPIAADAAPARAIIEVGLQSSDGLWQEATTATGRSLNVPVGIETVKIAPIGSLIPSPQVPVMANFGNSMMLIGYDMSTGTDGAIITLYWQALAPMSLDYTTFVHVLDGDGKLVTQHDSQPQDGSYPTSIWDVGEVVIDTKQIQMPSGVSPASYHLAVGIYRIDTLERLPLLDADTGLGDDNLLIIPAPSDNETIP